MTFEELMNCHPDNRATFDELKKQIQNVIPFIGAGMSAGICPVWRTLLEKMAIDYGLHAEVKEKLDKWEYEEAASLIKERIGKGDFLNILRREYDPKNLDKIKLEEPLTLIPKLFNNIVFTTNFDHLIEKAYEKCGNQFEEKLLPYEGSTSKYISRSTQKNDHILCKLHGDIHDADNLVLDKERYDAVYGSGPVNLDNPMPKALKGTCSARILLFLGCSMGSDRTLKVIEKVSEGAEHFALLELPKETENTADPLKPILKTADGKYIPTLMEKMKRLSDIQINRIWYPYGQHEAVTVLLRKLLGEAGASALKPTKENEYKHPHGFYGRDNMVDEIINRLNGTGKYENDRRNLIAVQGAPGIGKTEVCKEVLSRIEKRDILYIDVTSKKGLNDLAELIAKRLGLNLEGTPPDKYPNIIAEALGGLSQKQQVLLYIDNFEDLFGIEALDCEINKELIHWLREITVDIMQILLSTREFPKGAAETVRIGQLPLPAARELFIKVWEKQDSNIPIDDTVLNTLLEEMDRHALSIVLVAAQAGQVDVFDTLLKKWREAKVQYADKETHASMRTAVKMSWDGVKHDALAIWVWGLISLCPRDIGLDVLCEALEAKKEGLQPALENLTEANLAYYRDGKLAMLAPIKGLCFEYGKVDNILTIDECITKLGICYLERLHNANRNIPDHTTSHWKVLDVLAEMLFLLNLIMDKKPYEDMVKGLANRLYNYFIYAPYESLKSISMLLDTFTNDTKDKLRPTLLHVKGDLQKRLGQLEEALESYINAETLFRAKHENLYLANVLRSKGDLQRRLTQKGKAFESYEEAEKLYRMEHSNLGLANVLKSRGDLQIQLGHVVEALESYEEAERHYRTERDNLGLANVLRGRGDLQILLGQIKEARGCYGEAEKLYQAERANIGLANVLRSRGYLQKVSNSLEEAEKCFMQAAILYIEQQENMGLTYTLAELCDIFGRTGRKDELLNNILKTFDIMQQSASDHANQYAISKMIESMQRVKWISSDLKPLKTCPEELAEILRYIGEGSNEIEKTS